MSKYVYETTGRFEAFVDAVTNIAENISSSTTFEDEHWFSNNTALLTFERYSMIGSNRVSLSITITETEEGIELAAIPSGGSQAMFFKINIIGEGTFLDEFAHKLETAEETWK
jgi:hypothetical protein